MQAAIAWHARLRSEHGNDADERARFVAWLAEPGNDAAWRDVLALWDGLERPARALARGGWYRPRAERPRRGFAWAAAACLALCAVLGGALWRDPGLYDRAFADIATARGEQRRVTLTDGSTVTLDSDSAIDVRIDAHGRHIDLRRGRAAFDVNGVATPFVVRTPAFDVEDLSTRFVVDRRARGSVVAVEQGAVRVTARGMAPVVLREGARGHRRDGETQLAVRTADLARELGWRDGVLLYDRTPLAQVVRDLDRYSGERIMVSGDAAKRRPVTGAFRTADPRAAVAALESALGLRVTRIPGVVTLIH